jgi:antitoxin component of MazEF toxin-antitoxin module
MSIHALMRLNKDSVMAGLKTRRADSKSRVVLPEQFADRLVTIEQVASDEVRIKLARTPRKRPSLRALLDGVTEENLHENVDFGPPIGKELL